MSFGFSVGDIIAGASLCYKVSSAIKDGPAELNSARASLRSLTTLLERVDKEFGSLCEDEGRKEELVDIMVDCRSTVNKFKKVVEKYSDVDTGKKKRSMGLKVLKWSMKDKSALPEIQRAIGFHLGSLNAMMNVQHR